ncbi:MAG TPA: nitroreductase family protein [Nitrososphaeraceae archaeon]|nr:nitroreductase family protein [Nitrososphaeraceae archaeon]
MKFHGIEVPYASPGGIRLVWTGPDEEDEKAVVLSEEELNQLVEIFKKNTTGKIELADHASTVLINKDVTQFELQYYFLEVDTELLKRKIFDYVKVLHKYQLPSYNSTQFHHPLEQSNELVSEPYHKTNKNRQESLLQQILSSESSSRILQHPESDIFKIISMRRSTRRFTNEPVEEWKIDKILAAADTAPTAGNFQAFQVCYIKNKQVKRALAEAANNQPYVNAPAVFVFFMDPERIRMKLPPDKLQKFSLQDATLAASYAQLAASALGLSTIWIGMIDEEKIKSILNIGLEASSILCVGYPQVRRLPKSRRKLKDLIKVID